ncbi:MAG: hypothetical protein HY329_19965 [Chloroflexi bacterium]|nr:hypothetical protein [Chloroflexota bacterium]
MKLSQLIRTTMLPPTAPGGAPEALRAAGSAAATPPSGPQVDAGAQADQSPSTVSDEVPAAPLSASATRVESTSSTLDPNVVPEPVAASEAGPGESAAGREPSAVAERVLPRRQPITDDPDVKAFLENLRRRRAEQSASSASVRVVTPSQALSASVPGGQPALERNRAERPAEDLGVDRLESPAPLASLPEADLSEPVDETMPADSSPRNSTRLDDYPAPASAIPSPEAAELPTELGVSRVAAKVESSPTPALEAPASAPMAATDEPTSLEQWGRTKRTVATLPTDEPAEPAQVDDVKDQTDVTVPPINTPQPAITPPPAPTGSDETNRSIIGRLASRLGWKAGPTIARRSTVLRGHVDAVRSAVFSPDGASLLSGSADRTVRLWDLTSGEPRWIAKEHSGIVFSVAFSPDGRFVASGSADQIVRVATASTGDTVWATKGHSSIIWCVTFAPTGHLLATGSVDHQVRLWDVATGQLQRILLGHGDTVTTVAFAPSGTVLASASEDRTICLWDVASGQLIQVLEGHEDTVTSLAFSPDGSSLISGSEDKTLRVWDPLTATLQQLITGHEDWISSVAYSPNGRLLASASFDRAVWVWSADGQKLWSGDEHSNLVYCVAFSPDGRRLASASADQTIRIWDLDDLVAGPTDETIPTQGSTAGSFGRGGVRTGAGPRARGELASSEMTEPPLVAFADSALDAFWHSSWTDTVSLDSPLLVVEEDYSAAELVDRSHQSTEWSMTPATAPMTAVPVAPVQSPWVAETQDELQPTSVAEVAPQLGPSNAVADAWGFAVALVDVGEVDATMDENDTSGETGTAGVALEPAAPVDEDTSRRWAPSADASTGGAEDSALETGTSWAWETAGSVRDSYSTRFVPASTPPAYDAVDDRDYDAWTPAGDGDHDHYSWRPAGAGTEDSPILDRGEDSDATETRPAAVAAVDFEPSDPLPWFVPTDAASQAGEPVDEIADSSADVASLSPSEQLELVRAQVQSLADRIPQLSRTGPAAPVEPEAPSPTTPADAPPPEPIRLRRRSIIQLPLTERRLSATATARCYRVDGPRALPGSAWLNDLPRRVTPSVAAPPARPAGRRGLASFVKNLAGFDSGPAEQFSVPQPIDITDAIRALKFARDNRTLAAGSANGAIRIWDAPSQHVLWTFGGHHSIVTCLSFAPDGRTLASGGADHEISFWGVQGGQHLWTLEENDGPITAVAFAPDGRSLASGEEDGTIRLWSIAASVVRRLFSGHTAGVTALNFSPDGTILASSSRDGTIRLWNTATGNLERALVGHRDWANDVAFGADLRTLITVSSDRTVRIWSLQSDACRTLEGHEAPVTSVVALADGSLIASASSDGTIRLWDFQSGDLLRTLSGDDEGITALTASPDARWLVSGDEDGTLRIWDLESLWEPVNELNLPRASGWSLAARG